MRRGLLLSLGVTMLATPAGAEDCSKDVLAAFEKQRTSKAFRIAITQPSADGPVDMTVDYIPPSKMLQTIKSAKVPDGQQTLVDGSRAFSGTGGSWEELLPQFAQVAVNGVTVALSPPEKSPGEFECLGKSGIDGKEFLSFRLKAAAAPAADANKNDPVLVRTIYIDPATGLPALNIVGTGNPADPPVAKVVYSYPADVVIEAPEGAPIQMVR